jgi:hypothetical protein
MHCHCEAVEVSVRGKFAAPGTSTTSCAPGGTIRRLIALLVVASFVLFLSAVFACRQSVHNL